MPTIQSGQPDIAAVRSLLEAAGLQITSLESIAGGRVSWTYLINDEWIVQFPRFNVASDAMRVQSELMSLVQATVPFAVPVPEQISTYGGRPVMRYRMVVGRALRSDDQWLHVAPMLRALHGVPSDRAAEILGCEPTVEAWRSRYAQFREALEHGLYLRLSDDLRESMSLEYEHFLSGSFDFTPVFIHSDLGAEHIIVDPHTTRPCGVIDFDWASVGDPALDFVGLLSALGPDAVRQIIGAHGAEVSWPRLLFYWCLNPSYELVYAGEHLDEYTIQRGIDAIRERLSCIDDLKRRAG